MKQQIETMLLMQDQMNARVTADWREQNFEWYRAVWIECGELVDHYGWKWWKKQTPDMEQVRLEVVRAHVGDEDGAVLSVEDDARRLGHPQ